jgi:hypothetical protein
MMVEKVFHQHPKYSEWILHQLLMEVGQNIVCWH